MLLVLLASCGAYKAEHGNTGLQNFTTRYNILFNARTILNRMEHTLDVNYFDDYNQLLPVYKPFGGDLNPYQTKQLDSVVQKCNRIIQEKNKSDYVGEAYFMLGKVNELKGYYFQAAEYFRYVFRYIYDNPDLALRAKTREISVLWKTGADSLAKNNLDSALKYVSSALKTKEAIYATQAAAYIRSHEYANAAAALAMAIKEKPAKANRLRWSFLIAQLQELEKQPAAARQQYAQLKGNSVPFDIVMNATLRELVLSDSSQNQLETQTLALEKMLKKALYEEYYDRIYYRLGDIYSHTGTPEKARNAYLLSISHSSKRHSTLTGLGYLKLAESYFEEGQYVQAASAFDSTLLYLPTSHSERKAVESIRMNLTELAQLHKDIRTADSLKRFEQLSTTAQIKVKDSTQRKAILAAAGRLNKNFYFNNEKAIAQGRENFIKRWGNRALQDNWRTENSTVSLALPKVPELTEVKETTKPTNNTIQDSLRKKRQFDANERLAKSWYNLYSFYSGTIHNEAAAINSLKSLLRTATGSSYQTEAYYLLQDFLRLRAPQEAQHYRSLLLQEYPGSSYALALNPETELTKESIAQEHKRYTMLYQCFKERSYSRVIDEADEMERTYGLRYLSAQISYLKLLAVGYTQPLAPFEMLLDTLARRFPNDALISPLLKSYQSFIGENRSMLTARKTTLLEDNGVNLLLEKPQEETSQPSIPFPDFKPPLVVANSVRGNFIHPTLTSLDSEKRVLWADSGIYYFIINVNSVNLDLGPSRFLLRQFLRNYEDKAAILGDSKEINQQNTLLIIGAFPSFERVKQLEHTIIPVIEEIMKLSSERYNTFVIEKKDIQQLKDRHSITEYAEFYQNNK